MISLLIIIFFAFGLVIGSFLNVVILRFNTQKSFGGRSGCMTCLHKLSWYELVPVFSFIGLGGRCRNCKTKISVQYPIVELLTGFIFAGIFLKFQDLFFINIFVFSLTYAYYAVVSAILLIIATYDIKHKIIPDSLSLALAILGFVGLFFSGANGSLNFYPHLPVTLDFLSGILIATPFALFWLVSSGRWMGLGDAKLAIGLGWVFGWYRALSGVVLAFWIGATVGVILVLFSKKYRMKSEIPFAPYLVLGVLLAFLLELHIF